MLLTKEDMLLAKKDDMLLAKEDMLLAKEDDMLLAKEDMLLAKEDMLLAKEDDVTRKGRRCYSQRKIMSVPSGRGQGQKKRQKGKEPKTEEQTKGCGTDSAGFRSVGFQS